MAARAAGRKVIGVVGSAVPVELILAAGAFPLGLSARAEDYGQSAYPMERELDVEVQSLFRQAIGGHFTVCDAIVIASTSDGFRYLFQYLTEMRRTGQGKALPEVRLYDFLLGDGAPVAEYNRKVVAAFTGWLEELTGQAITATAIEAAIDDVNQNRQLLASMHDFRLQGRLSGSAARDAISAGRFLSCRGSPENPVRHSQSRGWTGFGVRLAATGRYLRKHLLWNTASADRGSRR